MRTIGPLVLSTLAIGGCGGCRRPTNVDGDALRAEAAAADASVAPGPWRAHPAARVLGGGATVTRLADGGLALRSGLFVHVFQPDGSSKTIGAPSTYALFVPEGEEIGGYDVTKREDRPISGSASRIFVAGGAIPQAFLWDGHEWTKTTETPPPVEKKGGDGDLAKLPKLANSDSEQCSFVESADDHFYAHCASYRAGEPPIYRLARLEGAEWVGISLPTVKDVTLTPRAVDAAGGVWMTGTPGVHGVFRATRGGEVEEIALEKGDAPRKPYYHSRVDTLVAPDAPGAKAATGDAAPVRRWTATTIRREGPHIEWPKVQQIVPRRSGDVFALVEDPKTSLSVYRIARDGKRSPPLLVRSSSDERVAVHGERPLRAWAGHCNHVFVALASVAKGEPSPSAGILERRAEIDAIVARLKKANKPSAQSSLVAGRLGDREVVGVVLLRSTPEASEADMEAVATALVERFTTNPASPPSTTCTLPILEELFDGSP